MDCREALEVASRVVASLTGHFVDVLSIKRPYDVQSAIELSKVVSKLSPFVANMLEYTSVQWLNTRHQWPTGTLWIRQDPGFPDTILSGMAAPTPGIEIKTWFPLATEITARFRDSQTHFVDNNTKVALICWMPEFVIAGRPKILGVWIGDAIDVAQARDVHYHNPPSYVVMEPEDTRNRTINLQQTNCNGHRFQGTSEQLLQAEAIVDSWGSEGRIYCPNQEYQRLLRELIGRSSFPYRLDTNFAKMDRIALPSLEEFKTRMLNYQYLDRTIQDWSRAITTSDATVLATLVDPQEHLPVR